MLQHGQRRTLSRRRLAVISLAIVVAASVLAPSADGGVVYGAAVPPVAQRGDRSSTVATAQRLLQNAGISVAGGVDGIYGQGTTAAVAEYQRRRSVPVTGVLDVGTATLLGVVPATPILQQGSSGAGVTQMQQRLLKVGISFAGGADGRFGAFTKAALQKFQASRGIPPSGALDAGTEAVLAHAAAPVAPPNSSAPAPAGLKVGSRGPEVVTLQRQLEAVGLRPIGGADGWFGAQTAASVQAFQRRSGLAPTGIADGATLWTLAVAVQQVTSPPPAVRSGLPLAAFPLPKGCSFRDTFGAPRSGGRTHEGVDLSAPRGTPIVAVQHGTITKMSTTSVWSLAGNGLRLTAADGTYFFYAHLDSFASGITVGSVVTPGTVIGFVGSTGNASSPHLHFEVHPGGGAAVNPTPIVAAAGSCT